MTERSSSTTEATEQEIVITRILDAPRELVFKAWTEPERFVRWWGPNGFTTPHCTIDLRPGGAIHFCMRTPEGQDFWFKGVFREVVEPSLLVFTDSFSDEEGNVVEPPRYGMSADFPTETLVTVRFEEHEGGKTKLTLRQTIPESVVERPGAQQGWSESFDRLAEDLAKAQGQTGPSNLSCVSAEGEYRQIRA